MEKVPKVKDQKMVGVEEKVRELEKVPEARVVEKKETARTSKESPSQN
jgi:hypothetical protein